MKNELHAMKITDQYAPDFHMLKDEHEKHMVVTGEFVFDVK